MKAFSMFLLLGALCVAVGVLTSHWIGSSEAHGGLFSTSFCYDGECHTELMVKYLGHGDGGRLGLGIVLGLVTLAGGIATAVLSTITGLSSMKGRRGPALVAVILAGITMFSGIVYLVLMRGASPGDWGFSTFVFFAGSGLVLAGAIITTSAIPAARPMMMGMYPGMMPPMGMQPGFIQQPPQPMTPPCNQCGGQTQFVQQYGKLFCGRCNRYLV